MYTLMMTRREIEYGSDRYITQEFYSADTLAEALAVGADHAWVYIDDEGYFWELYLEEDGE